MRFLIVFGLLINSLVIAQNHKAFLNYAFRADSAFGQGDYKKCAALYDLAFSADSLNVQGHKYMYCASCMALSNRTDDAFKYIYKAIDNGWVFYEDTKADPDLKSLHKAPNFEWDKMLDYFKSKVAAYEAALSKPALRNQLLAMLDEDQYYRSRANFIEHEYGKASRKLKKVWDTLMVVDSINLKVLTKTLDDIGFPTFDMVGIDGVEAMFVLLSHQHENIKIRERALVLAKEKAEHFGVSFGDIAYLEDQVRQDKGMKQKYGTRLYVNKGKVHIWPVEDVANLNALRLSMEMRPIELYAQEVGAKLPSVEDQIPEKFKKIY